MFGKRNNIITSKIHGGLGNQMFQYAIASILAKKQKSILKLDDRFFYNREKKIGFTPRSFELSVFDNKYQIATTKEISVFFNLSIFNRIKRKLGFNTPKVFRELELGFDTSLMSMNAPVYLEGYFQSYLYLIGYERFVKDLFVFPINQLDSANEKILKKLQNTVSVAIHIRRGDYVSDISTNSFHGVCDLSYYYKTIDYFLKHLKSPIFVFFSDDSQWTKNKFQEFVPDSVFIDGNNDSGCWKDMLLMSKCKHQIIANSSFSWWAAWLNENEHKIIFAPKQWFVNEVANKSSNDLIPSSWIRI